MKYHGRQRRKDGYDKDLVVKTVKRYISDLSYYNISKQNKYTRAVAHIIETLVIRSLINVQMTGNIDLDRRFLQETLTKEYIIEILSDYCRSRGPKNFDDIYAIVRCSHLKDIVNEMFGYDITNKAIGIEKEYDVICPCGTRTVFNDQKIIFDTSQKEHEDQDFYDEDFIYLQDNENDRYKSEYKPYKKVDTYRYICPKCGNLTYTHAGTNIPYGVPANKDTRQKRYQLHREIDTISNSIFDIKRIYKTLSDELSIEYINFHIGNLNSKECEICIQKIREITEEISCQKNLKR